MGRFYDATTPGKIDFMSKLPENIMMQATLATDKRLQDEEDTIGDLYGKLNAQALSPDKARKDEILKGYEGSIDELARKFQESPLEYTNTSGLTKKLSRQIHEDFTRGEVSSIQGNYNARAEFAKRYTDAVTKGDARAEDFQTAMDFFDSKFKGTNFDKESRLGKSYYTEELNKYVDLESLAEKRGLGYVEEITKTTKAYTDGRYIYKSHDSTEVIPFEDIYDGVLSAMLNDKELMDYYNQQVKFGAMTDAEKTRALNAAAARVAAKFDKDDSDRGIDNITTDGYGMQIAKEKLDREHHAWKKSYDEAAHITVDRNNEKVVTKTTVGKDNTIEGIEKDLAQREKTIQDGFTNTENELMKSWADKNPNASTAELKNARYAIQQAVIEAKDGNFENLKKAAFVYGGKGTQDANGNYTATGIDDFETAFTQTQALVANQKTLVNNMRNNIVDNMAVEDDKEISKRLSNPIYNYLTDYEKAQVKENLEKQYALNRIERANAEVNKVIGMDAFQHNEESVYSTGGNYYEDLPVEHKKVFSDYLKLINKNFHEYAATNGRAEVVMQDETGKLHQERVGFNQLVDAGILGGKEHELMKDFMAGKTESVEIIRDGKHITYQKGDVRIVPQNVEGVGKNSYQMTMVAQGDLSGTSLPKSITVYVPEGDLPPSKEIKEIYKSQEANTAVDQVTKDAERTFSKAIALGKIKPEQAEFKMAEAPGVSYYPGANKGQGEWVIKDTNGIVVAKYDKTTGRETVKNLLIDAGYGGSYNPELLEKATIGRTLKSESKSDSKSTYNR